MSTSLPLPTIFIFSEMKRTRVDEDFNPVYPYDTTSTPAIPFISPPFVNSDGFQESPPGILSLRLNKPLSFTNHAVSLNVGSGLTINSTGFLEATQQISAANPLLLQNNTLSLISSAPLYVNGSALALRLNSPFVVHNNGLAINLAEPLYVTNNSLNLRLASPFYVNNNSLNLRLPNPSGLSIDGSGLKVKAGYGLRLHANNDLYVYTDFPLDKYDNGAKQGQLYLRTGKGLQLSNNDLTVKLGAGLKFDNNGAITLAST
ncbi:short fiber 1 [Rhesus adenovirus 66]|nr:short fiber 1 [Rhesus adenovirus 66]